MTTAEATRLLEQFRAGKIPREKILHAFQAAPVADLGFAQVDMHRALRKNFPEVIFGAGKTPDQVVKIAAKLLERGQQVLVTRITAEHARALKKKFKKAITVGLFNLGNNFDWNRLYFSLIQKTGKCITKVRGC